MRSIWVADGGDGYLQVSPLPLPIRRITKPIDPEIFRRQARGENVGRPRLLDARGLRAVRCGNGELRKHAVAPGRQLCFVISGLLEVVIDSGAAIHLSRGDILLLDNLEEGGRRILCSDQCRLLQLEVAGEWRPDGTVGAAEDQVDDSNDPPQLVRMYRGDDDNSYFRPLDTLFPGAEGQLGEPTSVEGFHFVEFMPGAFIDWHPEGVNNFVVVLSGRLELEVGGGKGEVKVFDPGDVCLAEDRTGIGHIDPTHGVTRLALIVVADEHLWPLARAVDASHGTGSSADSSAPRSAKSE